MSKKFFGGLVLFFLFFGFVGSAVAQAPSLTSNLTVGSTGAQVTVLQDFLIAKGLLTMPPGVSKGYFGQVTRISLASYQQLVGITPAVGYLGPISRARINTELASLPPIGVTTISLVGQIPSQLTVGSNAAIHFTDASNISPRYNFLLRNASGGQWPIAWASTTVSNGNVKTFLWRVGTVVGAAPTIPGNYHIAICHDYTSPCAKTGIFSLRNQGVAGATTISLTSSLPSTLTIGESKIIRWTDTASGANAAGYNLLIRNSSGGQWPIVWDYKPTGTSKQYLWAAGQVIGSTLPAGTYHLVICHNYTATCAKSNNFQLVQPSAPVADNSACGSNNIPSSMVAGQSYNVFIDVQNTGTSAWSYAGGYQLESLGGWGISTLRSVTPSAVNNNITPTQPIYDLAVDRFVTGSPTFYRFLATLHTPTAIGTYTANSSTMKAPQFRMVKGEDRFGATCGPSAVTVTSPTAPAGSTISLTSNISNMMIGSIVDIDWTDSVENDRYSIILRSSQAGIPSQQWIYIGADDIEKNGLERSYDWPAGDLAGSASAVVGTYTIAICPLNADNTSAGRCAVTNSFNLTSGQTGMASQSQLAAVLQALSDLLAAWAR